MKNVAIIVDNITNRAGIERAVVNLSNLLAQSNEYDVLVVSLRTEIGSLPSYDLESKVKVLNLNLTKFPYLGFLIKCKKIIDDYKVDIMIGTTHALNSLLTFFKLKVRVIGCEHFNYDSCTSKSKVFRKIFYPMLDAVVVLTKADATNYNFLNQSKLHVIPNSLSFKCDKPALLDSKRIIAVGRLAEQKGYDYLIKIATLVKPIIPDWRIEIFGDGEQKEILLEEIRKKELDGYVCIKPPTNSIMDELRTSSIYVMTSRFEGLPMVLIEAQECGLPIISFDCKEGPADIVENGKNGFLVEIGDLDGFASHLCTLALENETRKKCGKQAKHDVMKFSPENIYQKWNNLFNKIEGY